MSTPYLLRAAAARDAEAIAVLHAGSWQRTYRGMMSDAFLDGDALENRRRVWRERLGAHQPARLVVVAEAGARVAGRDLMRAAAEWVCATEPRGGVYLWVMEANATARAFYDRLGARNAETIDLADPGGGHAPNCRYVWADAGALL